MNGYLHSTETLGTLDGPGIRTVFFLQGCRLKCAYCHNPDTWREKTGKIVSAEDIRGIAVRYKEYYGSTGGVTFSGGEPLLQAEFISECIKLLRAEGINVVIDTAGSVVNPAAFKALSECGGVILDIKHTDAGLCKKLCGGNLVDTIKTLEYIKNNNINILIRQVIIKGINDSEQQVSELKRIAGGADIELLPYHTLGVHKWEKLNMQRKTLYPPDAETMRRLNDIIKN